MMYCLNPKKPHENKGSSSSAPTVILSGSSTGGTPLTVEEQVTCHYCRYLLQGALLGDCRVTRWIGSGAFCDVYESEPPPPLNLAVATNVIPFAHDVYRKSAVLFSP